MPNQNKNNSSRPQNNEGAPNEFNAEKAKLIIENIINHPAAKNNNYLLIKAKQFMRKPSLAIFKKIIKYAQRLNLFGYDPNLIRPIVRNDPVTFGEIFLGVDMKTQEPCALNRFDIVRHLAILAGTGAGKSTLLRHLCMQLLCHGVNLTIFQKKRNQFENVVGERGPIFTTFFWDELRLSLFESSNYQNLPRWFQAAVSPIHEIFSLQNSIGFLVEAVNILSCKWPPERIRKQGFPTIRDLQEVLNQVPGVKPHQKKYIDSAESVLRRLWSQNKVFHARQGMYESMRDRPTIVNYGDGQVKEIKLIITHLADRFILDNQDLPEREKKFWVFIIDDAQEFMEKHSGDRIDSVANKINLTRENQLGFVMAFHTLDGVDPKYITSIENKITGYTKNFNMAISMTHLLGIRTENANKIAMLQEGQFIISSTSSQGAVMFQGFPFEHPDIVDKPEWDQQNEERKKQYHYTALEDQSEKETREKDKPEFSENAKKILIEIANHPYLNSSELKERLEISNDAFNKGVEQLISLKILVKQLIGPWKAFELSSEGWRKVGLNKPVHKGGFVHAFAVDRIEKFFKNKAFDVKREFALAPSSHLIDLCAFNKETILAIEFETGQSNYFSNLIECVKTKADRIFCVTKDDEFRKKITPKLKENESLKKEILAGRLEVTALWNFLNPKTS